jgi:hypothetical protein
LADLMHRVVVTATAPPALGFGHRPREGREDYVAPDTVAPRPAPPTRSALRRGRRS